MSIYLAWSFYKLVAVILVATISLYLGLRYMDKVSAKLKAEDSLMELGQWV